MKRKSNRRSEGTTDTITHDVSTLLREIEKEPVPERLLQLAIQLQEALAAQHGRDADVTEEPMQPRTSHR